MGRLNKFYYGILTLAILFALWGFGRWLQAQIYMPPSPVMAAAKRYSFGKPASAFPLFRYAQLQTGELFFGPASKPTPVLQPTTASGPPKPPKPVFNSKLLLYGVTKGVNAKLDRAIVGLIADPARQTWLVQPGSVMKEY
jgi:hypothetical protein